MRPPVPAAAVAARLERSLRRAGAEHPGVGAAVLSVRGRSGLRRDEFARRAGVEVDLLARAEAGALGRDQLPGALRRMVPPD